MNKLEPICYIDTTLGRALIAKSRNVIFVMLNDDDYEAFTCTKRAMSYIKTIRVIKAAA